MAATPWRQMSETQKAAYRRTPQYARELAAKKAPATGAPKPLTSNPVTKPVNLGYHAPTAFKRINDQIYGSNSATDGTFHRFARELEAGTATLEDIQRRIKQGEAVSDPMRRKAGIAVATELDPQLSALKRKEAMNTDLTNSEIDSSTKQSEKTRAAIKKIYEALGIDLQAGIGRMGQNYDQAQAAVGKNYQDASASIGQAYGGAQAATSNEAARLGLSAATPEATAPMARDQAFLQGLMGTNNQAAQNTMEGLQSSQQGWGQASIMASGAESAGRQANNVQQLEARVNDLRATLAAQVKEYRGQGEDLEGTRYGKIQQTIDALRSAEAEAQAEAEDREFARYIAEEKLGISRDTLSQRASDSAFQRNLDTQKLGLDQSRLTLAQQEAQQKEGMSQLEKDKMIAETARINATTANLLDPASKPAKADTKGWSGAMNYVGIASGGDEVVAKDLEDIVSTALWRHDYKSTDMGMIVEEAVKLAASKGYDEAGKEHARNAILHYFGNG